MKKISRRTAIKSGVAAAIVSSARAGEDSKGATQAHPTPADIEGPFYPMVMQKDKDFDLTLIAGHTERAQGEQIIVEGQVVGTDGQPIMDASVDLWQACASGKYNHPHDANPAPSDPHFQGWAIVPSGSEGGFRFRTIMPGAYPAAPNWTRPPHIHFKVSKRGYVELVTQMYFPGHPLNESDRLLQRKSGEEQSRMIAARTSDDPPTFRYRIVLQKA